jgi:hypothetical protein
VRSRTGAVFPEKLHLFKNLDILNMEPLRYCSTEVVISCLFGMGEFGLFTDLVLVPLFLTAWINLHV